MKIPNEVLAILSTVDIDESGMAAIITEQLERRLYVKTNEVLEALGGRWNRKAKAHLFATPARARLEQAMMSGDVTTPKDLGYFPTPDPVARDLVRLAGPLDGKYVLEPSAGVGSLVDASLGAGAAGVVAVERDPHRRAELRTLPYPRMAVVGIGADAKLELDFMDMTFGDVTAPLPPGQQLRAVVMNPPFCKVGLGDHLDHVRHAFGMLENNAGAVLVSILPAGVVFREDKRHREFRAWIESNGGVLRMMPEGSFKESGTGVRTATLRMERGPDPRS